MSDARKNKMEKLDLDWTDRMPAEVFESPAGQKLRRLFERFAAITRELVEMDTRELVEMDPSPAAPMLRRRRELAEELDAMNQAAPEALREWQAELEEDERRGST